MASEVLGAADLNARPALFDASNIGALKIQTQNLQKMALSAQTGAALAS